MTATHKTVTFLVVLCALVILSLFIYRTQYNSTTKAYTSEYATMFPVGREIKSFSLLTTEHEKFSNKDLMGHWTLLFFGFTHCASICPTTLDLLAQSYDKLLTIKPDLQVIFVSLDPERDNAKRLADYTQHFNRHFVGVLGKMNEIRKLQAQLHIFSEQEPKTSSGEYQIQHTSSIVLINPKGEWAGLFGYGMKPEQFVYEFEMATTAAA